MRGLSWGGIGCLLLLGCVTATPRKAPSTADTSPESASAPAQPPPPAADNPLPVSSEPPPQLTEAAVSVQEEKTAPEARPTPPPAPVFPAPGEGEGTLVGTLGIIEDDKALLSLSCTWLDIRLRSLPTHAGEAPVERSFIRTQAAAGAFPPSDRKRELFALSVPSGSYELTGAKFVCKNRSLYTKLRYGPAQGQPIQLKVAPGTLTYLGAFSFNPLTWDEHEPGPLGARLFVQNQWERDSRALQSTYPLVDWDRTVMRSQVARLPSIPDASPARLLEDLQPSHPGVPPPNLADVGESLSTLEASCARGHAVDCFNLGILFWVADPGIKASERRAARFFERACTGGVAPGCFNAGTLWTLGRGVARKDPGRAAGFFQRACRQGVEGGCLSLARLHEKGIGAASPSESRKKARVLYEEVCARGSAEGCFALGLSHAMGRGGPKNDTHATTFLKKGCEGGHPNACIAAEQLARQLAK